MSKADSPFAACPLAFPSTRWRGLITRVKDGDTIVVKLDHGFFTILEPIEFRFISCDVWEDNVTPKQTAAQTQRGIDAREYLKTLCTGRWAYVMTAMDKEKYGRILGDPYVESGGMLVDVALTLKDKGYVKTWTRP